ncbi:hypothetical protein [Spectribacter hydrogenoxidans]|uniref:HD domain-containing protein n=1 Tax=Spectribacter hydrogenoxidans TaxID=3075608 RepID=A0ABU3BXH3_9GAMM|nr:hypothetical protein [Salinisphaera sp. W335]MDT0633997.1 hypothetical protein [Salinisphaera sp. W335]
MNDTASRIEPLIDEILDAWRPALGDAYPAYRNHAQRVLALTLRLGEFDDDQRRSLAIAAAFHDLGIWSDGTLDYLEPSVDRARAWLADHNDSQRGDAVAAVIRNHHRVRGCRDEHAALTEPFRRADLIDVSLGLIRFGIPRRDYRALVAELPHHRFHRRLIRLFGAHIVRHPLQPAPMFKW